MPVIELDRVTKTFRALRGTRVLLGSGGLADILTRKKLEVVTALDDISFTVEQGESLGIIGANGSGKSTLLKIIAGVTIPTEGTIGVRGRVFSSDADRSGKRLSQRGYPRDAARSSG